MALCSVEKFEESIQKLNTVQETREAIGRLAICMGKLQGHLAKLEGKDDVVRYGLFTGMNGTTDDSIAWHYFDEQLNRFWKPDEHPHGNDRRDMELLERTNPPLANFMKSVLSFFATADTFLVLNISQRFKNDATTVASMSFYAAQEFFEYIHAWSYGLQLDGVIVDSNERKRLREGVKNSPAIAAKAAWMQKFIESEDEYAVRMIAFACAEGIFFIASFSAIYWFKSMTKFMNIAAANEMIARDEMIHRDFACDMYRHGRCGPRLTDERVHQIVREAVEAETTHMLTMIPEEGFGVYTREAGLQNIQFYADMVLTRLGHPRLYDVTNPFDFMVMNDLPIKGNMQEVTVTQYQRPSTEQFTQDYSKFEDADF